MNARCSFAHESFLSARISIQLIFSAYCHGACDGPSWSTTEKIIEEIENTHSADFYGCFYLSQVAKLLALASILMQATVHPLVVAMTGDECNPENVLSNLKNEIATS